MTSAVLIVLAIDGALLLALFAILTRIDRRLEHLERHTGTRTRKNVSAKGREKKG